MDLLNLIKQTRSCRIFENRQIPLNDLEWLIECARYAPTARNAQQLRFIIVNGKESADAISANVRWAKRNGEIWSPHANELPRAYIIIAMPSKETDLLHYDAGIAAQTIQLAAAVRDLATCIIWAFHRSNLASLVKLPDTLSISLLLACGYPSQKREAVTARESINLYDKDGVHYAPKLPLEELILKVIS